MPGEPLDDPRLGEVEVLVPPMRTNLRSFVAGMTSLKLVQCASAGVEWIVDQVPSHITLCSCRGALDTHVSEWVIAAILSAQKRFPFFLAEQREGRWTREPVPLLEGASVVLLGYGSIARAVERRLEPFSPAITRIARRPRSGVLALDALGDVLPRADVLVVLLPLTSATRGLVDGGVLALLPDGALLINAARGQIVDGDALQDELRAGRLRAFLDVTEPEPLPPGHFFYSDPGAFLTPHIAGWTEGLGVQYELVAGQLKRYADAEPLINVVEDGY